MPIIYITEYITWLSVWPTLFQLLDSTGNVYTSFNVNGPFCKLSHSFCV